ETIKTELILADLETMTKRVVLLEKETKSDFKKKSELEFAKKVSVFLEKGDPARDVSNLSEDESIWLKSYQLLSAKPHIYVENTDKEKIENIDGNQKITINAKIESELADLAENERDEYLKELGINEPGLNLLIRKAYDLLGLISYFTAGEKEVRAWTIKKGFTAPRAAGVIHTDFEKGFIKADIVYWKDLVDLGGWVSAREAGRVRLEGRDYLMKDGDVALFKSSS
ncbi:MAG: DUF933 domain-containing protein, partial [Patescibacteria group bacterium]|nr:DUF933 domain-containing protein [Patescibacteria group bacterium]